MPQFALKFVIAYVEPPCCRGQHVLRLGGGGAVRVRSPGGEALLIITYLCKLQNIPFIPETNSKAKSRGP